MSEVFFNGPAGRIEGKHNVSEKKQAPVVLILHPHPLYGGSMNNKVVHTIYRSFSDLGFTTLRINFRGVGKSQGTFNNGIGELMDATIALDWLQVNSPSISDTWIAGFSFGSWIGMQLMMRRPEISRFIAVSPPAGKYDFNFLSPCPIPGMIVQGDMDSIVMEKAVKDLWKKIDSQKFSNVEYKLIEGADHFFRDKLDLLKSNIEDYIKSNNHMQVKEYVKKKRNSATVTDDIF